MKPVAKSGRIKKTRWLTCLFIWWVVVVFIYLFIAAQERSLVEQATATGIKAANASAQQAGLPLLERDVRALTRLVQDISTINGVVNVSIIDHKNKIIAFTNPDQPLAVSSQSSKMKNGVSYWLHELADGTRAVCFSNDISYAGTKIGEVFLAIEAKSPDGLITAFVLTALISFMLIVFVLLLIDFNGLYPLKSALSERIHRWTGKNGIPADGREVICPVCGSHKPLNHSFLLEANLDRYPVVRMATEKIGATELRFARGVNLREISRREDLGWLRRQMIHRCADIIKKLAGD
ncbi:hypothetical protein [Desulfosarcina sp.]|uniref:hypothetical protein n=1 Tax=Desulfosarcina sp. TaxID=2027861 RepID=UPI003970D01A